MLIKPVLVKLALNEHQKRIENGDSRLSNVGTERQAGKIKSGHYWVQAGPNKLVGKHYNSGPFGASQWWSSDAPDGGLLWVVKGTIDTWSPEKAKQYAAQGYVHYHELVKVSDGTQHPTKVLWLKHIARTSFTFDGGPHPEFGPREVTPGVDYDFLPNGLMPYYP